MSAKTLFLLRHAQAPAISDMKDKDRPLSDTGKQQALKLGQVMAEKGWYPDQVLCSPATRTRETLKNLKEALPGLNALFPDRLYNASAGEILSFLKDVKDTNRSVLVIAHNPGIHHLAKFLAVTGCKEDLQRLSLFYAPCTLTVLDVRAPNWHTLDPGTTILQELIEVH